MDNYKKITRLQISDKHVLHKYESDFFEFSPESIKDKITSEADLLNDDKEIASTYFMSRKISL